jgi:high affinity Mn2+ porin
MSLLDFFDVNAIGSDNHYQFLNWTVDNNAPYGYPADSRGYTYAFLAEYHERA